MKRIRSLVFVSAVIVLVSCDKPYIYGPVVDIFALGSSFTNQYVFYFQNIATCNGDSTFMGEAAIGNAGLKHHIEESNTVSKLVGSHWDYIMIQESGFMACLPEEDCRESTFKCVELLVDTIRKVHPDARIGLFMTQAYERGHEDRCTYDSVVCTYSGMQGRIIENYIRLAREFGLELAPVGYYWQKFRQENPEINLFCDDHSHGSEAGRYLTACIIYTTIYNKPVVNNVPANILSETISSRIREFVNSHVFNNSEWEELYNSVE